MKYAHSIKLTVFSYEHENLDLTLESFQSFFPFNLGDSKVLIKRTQAAGFNEKKITILEAVLEKNSLINDFLDNLLGNLDESQKTRIMLQLDSRLDKNLDFFLRFEKDQWMQDKKLVLTDGGECFHIRIGVAAFPKKRANALRILKGLFSKNKGL